MWMVRHFPADRVIHALQMMLDGAPPGYLWLVDGAAGLLGPTRLALRLPSIIGFYVFSLSILQLLRGRVADRILIFALFFTCVTGAFYASTFARPYAIVLGCFGLAAAAWAGLPQSRRRELRYLLSYFSLSAALCVHFLAIYLVAALGVAELLRSWRNGKILWGYWLSELAATMTLFLWLPVIGPIFHLTHASINAPGYYAKPGVDALIGSLYTVLEGTNVQKLLVVAALLLIPLFLVGQKVIHGRRAPFLFGQPNGKRSSFQDLDILIVAAFALPFVAYGSAVLILGTLNARYFLGVVLGLVLLVARGLSAFSAGPRVASVLLVVTLVGLIATVEKGQGVDPRATLVERAVRPLPIVVPSGSDFMGLSEELPPKFARRVAFVEMPVGTPSPDPEPELVLRYWKAAVPSLPVYSASTWFRKWQTFYLLDTFNTREGLTAWLIAHGRVRVVAFDGPDLLLMVEMSGQSPDQLDRTTPRCEPSIGCPLGSN
jgi:hypothetical protein